MAIKNVVFDFGGVLLDWNPRYLYKDVFNDDKKMEFFLQNICTNEWNAQMDKGKPFEEAIAELSAQFPQYKDEIALYYSSWGKMLQGEIKEGLDIFNKVVDSGRFKVYGLTNWSYQTFPIAFSRYRFLDKFEGIVVSGEEKMIKPEKGIYHILFERYHLIPNECVFIDDNKNNIDSCIAQGMHGIHLTSYKEAKEQLSKLLDLTL